MSADINTSILRNRVWTQHGQKRLLSDRVYADLVYGVGPEVKGHVGTAYRTFTAAALLASEQELPLGLGDLLRPGGQSCC